MTKRYKVMKNDKDYDIVQNPIVVSGMVSVELVDSTYRPSGDRYATYMRSEWNVKAKEVVHV